MHFGHKGKNGPEGRSKDLEKAVADVEYPHYWPNVVLIPYSFLVGLYEGKEHLMPPVCADPPIPQKMQVCDRDWRENCILITSSNSF